MTVERLGYWLGFSLRWALLIYAMSLSPWPVAVVLSMFGVGIDWQWRQIQALRKDLDNTTKWLVAYVEADTEFTNAVTAYLEQQAETVERHDLLSSLHVSARLTRH